jgi:hypothetical protein
MDKNQTFTNSFMDYRSTDTKNTSEILFMKRLLFLKASLDNDNNNNMANVPLEEDK